MKSIKAIIVDDESTSIDFMLLVLNANFPEVDIIKTCQSVDEGISAIDELKPELVFLDIEIGNKYGFELLENVTYKNFNVIFISSYSEYAVRAFEFSALHYLLKPINVDNLREAIFRLQNNQNFNSIAESLNVLRSNYLGKPTKIFLPTGNGKEMFDIDSIIRCEADGNYTNIYFKNKKFILISKNLQLVENMLERSGFVRIHRKFLVNMSHIHKYHKGKQPSVVLSDGFEINISENYFQSFKEKFSLNAIVL